MHTHGRWIAERAQFYCGMPELLAFAEMCQQEGGLVRVRVRVRGRVS